MRPSVAAYSTFLRMSVPTGTDFSKAWTIILGGHQNDLGHPRLLQTLMHSSVKPDPEMNRPRVLSGRPDTLM